MKYAIVTDGKVENLIEWDGESPYEVDGELIELKDDANVNIGATYKKGKFTNPEPEPQQKPVAEG